MEVAIGLIANKRSIWSLDQIASDYPPVAMRELFTSVAPNPESRKSQFPLSKEQLRARIGPFRPLPERKVRYGHCDPKARVLGGTPSEAFQ
jgi:hypothetical protein